MNISSRHCVPCEGGTKPLTPSEYTVYLDQVPGWIPYQSKSLTREYTFTDFKSAIKFINQVADIAESESHHPDINLHDYKHVTFTLSTHAIGGLSVNDFVLAAKINDITIL